MKYLLIITASFIFILNSNAQDLKTENDITGQRLPFWFSSQLDDLDLKGQYYVHEQMNPMYLEADFNGGGALDIAVFIYEAISKKEGILIYHGENGGFHVLGAGNLFNGRYDVAGIEIWKLYRKKTAGKTVFAENGDIEGSEIVTLPNIAIEVSRSESSSNLILWNGNKYVWIHTGE
jgi:hypothetical protein